MRLGRIEGGAAAAGLVSDGRDAGERGPVDGELLGSWSATRWQYTSRARPDASVDVVCDLGGTVTLSLSAETYVLTWSIAGQGSRSEGGMCEVLDEQLRLTPEGADRADVVRVRIARETLSLSADASAWHFDGDGEDEAADFIAVLVRL